MKMIAMSAVAAAINRIQAGRPRSSTIRIASQWSVT
jgi:hypothetical protein